MTEPWAFGRPNSDSPETVGSVPPGFRIARAIPMDAPFGKMLSCRSCGALIAATDNAVTRHTTFHRRLGQLVAGNLDMNYDPGNPNQTFVYAEPAIVRIRVMFTETASA